LLKFCLAAPAEADILERIADRSIATANKRSLSLCINPADIGAAGPLCAHRLIDIRLGLNFRESQAATAQQQGDNAKNFLHRIPRQNSYEAMVFTAS
jgi:hypothetical protein